MGFIEGIANWNWGTRIIVGGLMIGASTFMLLFAGRIWVWGWVVGVIIFFVPFMFSDKGDFVEHSEEDEVELHGFEVALESDGLQSYFEQVSAQVETGFDQEKILKLVSLILDLEAGAHKIMNYYVHLGGQGMAFQVICHCQDSDGFILKMRSEAPLISRLETGLAASG